MPSLLRKELQLREGSFASASLLQETLVSFKYWLRDLLYYVGFEAVQKLSAIRGLGYFIRINQR